MITTPARPARGIRHEALFYAGEKEFLVGTLPFIRQGLDRDEAVLVVVSATKIEQLEDSLGGDGSIEFADMSAVGKNPARLIPLWRRFAQSHEEQGKAFRGIGEPVSAGRTPAELAECLRHESLLNLAFAQGAPWELMCPYDTETLDREALDGARRTHPLIVQGELQRVSRHYAGLEAAAAPFTDPLPEPPDDRAEIQFSSADLPKVRHFIRDRAKTVGLHRPRADDLVLATDEVATNSVRFGGGGGTLGSWQEDGSLIVEIRDEGRIHDPLVGREPPHPAQTSGRGLWLANQLCDLVQIQALGQGTVVRLHMAISG